MAFPFYDSADTAVFTCRHIFDKGKPILYVSHDEDDGAWQFLCGGSHTTNDAMLVSLKTIYEHDNSVGALADMPLGYYAERKSLHDKWIICKA